VPKLRFVSAVAPVLASFLLACGDATGAGSDVLRARAVGPVVILATDEADPVHYFVVDRASASLIDWAPCTNPVGCPSVSRGAPVRIPSAALRAEVAGGGEEAIVYHWQLHDDGAGGYRLGEVRSVTVSLRPRLFPF